jgi:hypothetical protein
MLSALVLAHAMLLVEILLEMKLIATMKWAWH